MVSQRVVTLATTIAVGMLVGSGVGAAILGGELVRLRAQNSQLRDLNRDLSTGGMYHAEPLTPADLPRTLEDAREDGYRPVYWGRCEPDAGYHYARTDLGYEGPRLLFAEDGTFLGYKHVAHGPRTWDLPTPWTFRSDGHDGERTPHWDLYLFDRDPTGACA